MSDAGMRAAIKARLEAFGTVMGRVHDYERWAVNAHKFLEIFQDEGTRKIFGWEITRTGFRTEKAAMAKWRLTHQYLVRGYYGLQDAEGTEKALNTLVDAIVLDFVREPLAGSEKAQFPRGEIGTRMFGSVLCHVAEIVLPEVTEIIRPLPWVDEADLLGVGLDYYLEPDDDGEADASDVVVF